MCVARPEYCTLTYAFLALIIASICTLAQPFYFGKIIDACSNENKHDLNLYSIYLLVIFSVGGVFTYFRAYLYTVVGERLVRNIRRDLFTHLLSLDISFFDINKTGELISRLSSDTTVMQSCLSVNISMALRFGGQIIVSTVLLFVTSWKLTLVVSC